MRGGSRPAFVKVPRSWLRRQRAVHSRPSGDHEGVVQFFGSGYPVALELLRPRQLDLPQPSWIQVVISQTVFQSAEAQ